MSDVKGLDICCGQQDARSEEGRKLCGMVEIPANDGQYVLATDYDALAAECERLRAKLESLEKQEPELPSYWAPNGWPTSDMIEAGADAFLTHKAKVTDLPPEKPATDQAVGAYVMAIFSAMVEAAPKQQSQEPVGWKLVPIEPTQKMIEAANSGDQEYTDQEFGKGHPLVGKTGYDHWHAMIEVAPSSQDDKND